MPLTIRFSLLAKKPNRLWNVQQAGCLAEMKLPANTVGDPHAIFDSTGMVFAVTAAMAGGIGNVSSVPTLASAALCLWIPTRKSCNRQSL
jgi:hypothetical protein